MLCSSAKLYAETVYVCLHSLYIPHYLTNDATFHECSLFLAHAYLSCYRLNIYGMKIEITLLGIRLMP